MKDGGAILFTLVTIESGMFFNQERHISEIVWGAEAVKTQVDNSLELCL